MSPIRGLRTARCAAHVSQFRIFAQPSDVARLRAIATSTVRSFCSGRDAAGASSQEES